MASKKALITGITGQDGSYLAELLLEKGYEVHGLVRRSSSFNTWRIDHVRDGSLSTTATWWTRTAWSRTLETVEPDEVYNLAAQSHVKVSFEMPEYTTDVTAIGVLRVLDAVRETGPRDPGVPGGQLGDVRPGAGDAPDREDALPPPLALRGAQGLRALDGGELPRELRDARLERDPLQPRVPPSRGELRDPQDHHGSGRASSRGAQKELRLGNLDAKRDWGFAGDYVEAMWRMLQQDEPDDYVIATGETHSVREFCEEAFSAVGLDWQEYVKVDPKYFRPAEVDLLLGDPSKARKVLGWEPRVTFKDLARLMVEADLEAAGSHPTRSR